MLFDEIKTTKKDFGLILKIVERAESLGISYSDRMTRLMDLEAANYTCPLKLDELLVADDENFIHDVTGIARHINRTTGKLEGCFLPRFAK